MKNRAVIASQCPVKLVRGVPAPCYTPNFDSENELYEKFDGLNEISIAQQDVQYRDIVGVRLQPLDAPPSLFDGCDDGVIMDNILPKHVSTNDIFHAAMFLQDELQTKSD